MFAHVHADNYGEYFVCVTAGSSRDSGNVYELFSVDNHTAETEAAFVERVRELFGSEIGNSHVAEPIAGALDAVFGGNPVEQVDNLISDTVKNGKEGGDE